MDEQTARMIQQLKNNPAMLQALMQSRDGQDLLRMLSGGDQGASLQRAAQSAARGDPAGLLWFFEDHDRPPQGWNAGGRRVRRQARPRTTGGGQGDCPYVGSFGWGCS